MLVSEVGIENSLPHWKLNEKFVIGEDNTCCNFNNRLKAIFTSINFGNVLMALQIFGQMRDTAVFNWLTALLAGKLGRIELCTI